MLALSAGADLLRVGARVAPELIEEIVATVSHAVESGRLPLERLESAAARVRDMAGRTRSGARPRADQHFRHS